MPSTLGVVAANRTAPPSPIPLPGLAAWWDADDAATFTLTGALVEQWRDKSGAGATLNAPTAGKRPSRSGTQNGHTTVVFNHHVVKTSAGVTAIGFAPSYTFTLCVANKHVTNTSYNALPVTMTNAYKGAHFEAWNSDRFLYTDSQGGFVGFGADAATKAWHILTDTLNGTTLTEYLNGTLVKSATFAGTGPDEPQVVGFAARDDGVTEYVGEIAEAIVYNRVLSTVERQQVESYLKTKWGTP
jgi:hypothetical protein